MPYANHIKEFKVKFNVGQRVRVDFGEYKKLGIKITCDTGMICSIRTRFMLTPETRKVVYTVWMDEEWKIGDSVTVKMDEEQLSVV